MVAIIGFSGWGLEPFYSTTSSVNKIYYGEIQKGIYDELRVDDGDRDKSNVKDVWKTYTLLLGKFQGDYELGNVSASGLRITKFIIKRRKINELNNITLGYRNFANNEVMEYIDNTQDCDEFIYSVVPLAINGLEGKPNETSIKSEFTGFYIVDKLNNNNTIACDKFIGSEPEVSIKRNEGRVLIETFSQFPTVYKTPKRYHEFSLSCTIAMENENVNSYSEYQKILSLIDRNEPMLIKSGSGDVYICEISNPRKVSPMNAHRGRDYFVVDIDCVECMSYDQYNKLYVGGDV